MGRTAPTATMRVYEFEKQWAQFTRAPRKVEREAFAELVAFAHFHAAPIAHSGSPYLFEMIVLTMLLGTVPRLEALEARAIALAPDVKPALLAVMEVLRGRLASQKHELYIFARALRQEDQKTLRALLAMTQTSAALEAAEGDAASDERLLTALLRIMLHLRQLEKRYVEGVVLNQQAWSLACAA